MHMHVCMVEIKVCELILDHVSHLRCGLSLCNLLVANPCHIQVDLRGGNVCVLVKNHILLVLAHTHTHTHTQPILMLNTYIHT